MHKLLKMIPTTPDMVSLWLPSGYGRAQDIIRGNHGQCFGTHPNVPVLPNLINPSVGWHFDKVNDYINCGTGDSLKITTEITIAAWINGVYGAAELNGIISKYGAINQDYYMAIYQQKLRGLIKEDGIVAKLVASATVLTDDTWYRAVFSCKSGAFKLYINGNLNKTEIFAYGAIDTSNEPLIIGARNSGIESLFDGYIALPSLANKAWSQAQVTNDYLNTKSLFSPRG